MTKFQNFPTDGSMFKKDENPYIATVCVVLDNRRVSLPKDASLAAGLLGIGEIESRVSLSSGKTCSPHCLMGVCCECMMEIDGIRRQACMTEPREGMVINRHLGSKPAQQEEDIHASL